MSIKGMLSVNFDPPQLEFVPYESASLKSTMIFGKELEVIKNALIDLGLFGSGQEWPSDDCLFRVSVALSKQQLDNLKAVAIGSSH